MGHSSSHRLAGAKPSNRSNAIPSYTTLLIFITPVSPAARRSTGPKTERGKNHSRFNALRHGILSKAAIIPTGPGKEDPKDFALLMEGLIDYYQPVGMFQQILVEEIAICLWRKRRVLRYETGEVRGKLGYPAEEEKEGSGTKIEQLRFLSCLKRARKAVERYGLIPSALKQQLRSFAEVFELEEELVRSLDLADATSQPGLGRDGTESLRVSKTSLMQDLGEYISSVASRIERDTHYTDVVAARASLPNSRELDLILGYEASLDRQLYGAVGLLQSMKDSASDRLIPAKIA